MLPRKVVTKKDKKKRSRKRLAAVLIVIGLFIIAFFLSISVFFDKGPLFVSPLSKDQITSSSKIEKILKENKVNYISLDTEDDLTYSLKLDKEREVILDSNKEIAEQISSLQLILSQLKIEGRTFKRLDFRYQKPIISF